ncbi:hypothetical protein ACFONN_05675 [Dyella humi]|uniref:Relaxation protein n=1 Tax=Dyella humi TaxID=1770547 RepID=A0ABW8IHB1_9GAMM
MDERTKLVQAAGIMERMARLNQELSQSNLRAADLLERTANATPSILQNAAQQTLGQFTSDIAKAVHNGLNQPLGDFNRHVTDSVNHINSITHGMMQSQEQMTAIIRKLRWLVIGVLATMLLAIVAGSSLFWHYRNVIADNQIEADLMRAYNQADVRLCDGRLCARVDRADKRYGDYVIVKPRPE